MAISQMLFGLGGRLNRKPYWIVGLILLGLLLVVTFIIVALNAQAMQVALESPDATEPLSSLAATEFLIAGFSLLMVYPSTALMVKRFHDLGKSGKWALILLIPALGKFATDLIGFTGQEIPLSEYGFDGTESFLEAWKEGIAAELRIRPIEFAVDLYIFLVTVWFLIWLGFFRGTSGPNRFGADPLAT